MERGSCRGTMARDLRELEVDLKFADVQGLADIDGWGADAADADGDSAGSLQVSVCVYRNMRTLCRTKRQWHANR